MQVRYRLDNRTSFMGGVALGLPKIISAIKQHSTSFSLKKGEGYVVNNRRMIHARSAPIGERLVERVHADPIDTAPYGSQVNLGFIPKPTL